MRLDLVRGEGAGEETFSLLLLLASIDTGMYNAIVEALQ